MRMASNFVIPRGLWRGIHCLILLVLSARPLYAEGKSDGQLIFEKLIQHALLSVLNQKFYCEKEHYYESEKITCAVNKFGPEANDELLSRTLTVKFSILGKEMKQVQQKLLSSQIVDYTAPPHLQAIVPLSIEAIFMEEHRVIDKSSTTVHLYPRDPSFYIKPDLMKGKRIAVDDPTSKLKKELDYLKIPYDSVRMTDMPPKRYDLFILGRSSGTAEDVVPANGSPVIQLDVDTHLDDDPLTRWLLAKRIRAVFKQQNDAKDLTGTQSNH